MTNEQILTFLRGGKATFTIESKVTGKHYTFKVTAPKNKNDLLWVSLLTGTNDEYHYLGTMFLVNSRWQYRLTAKSKPEHKVHRIFAWFIFQLQRGADMNPDLVFRHSGVCSRCQRKLTTPQSIDLGMGPVCYGKTHG